MSSKRMALVLCLALVGPVAYACGDDGPTEPAQQREGTEGTEGTGTAYARLDGADQGGKLFTTTLSGAEEDPPNNSPGTGTFTMTINPGQGILCYETRVSNLSSPITNSHIHIGAPGVTGPPVVQLDMSFSGFTADCLSVEANLLRDIRKNPEAYYVNVHTVNLPGGEVRGQLD